MTSRPFRVLLVEDNPSNIALFTTVLKRDGYTLEVVTDGSEVEQRAAAVRPDLILMDINLPGMTGTELVGRLRADPSTADVPILALTAHAMDGDADVFLALGFNGYISKPIEVAAFRDTVRQTLAKDMHQRRGSAK